MELNKMLNMLSILLNLSIYSYYPNILLRLVSSGEYDNSVTVLVKAASDEDLDFSRNLVMTCPEFMGTA